MFKLIIDLLNVDEFYGVSKEIDIAKGMYKYPKTLKEGFKLFKRIRKSNYKK